MAAVRKRAGKAVADPAPAAELAARQQAPTIPDDPDGPIDPKPVKRAQLVATLEQDRTDHERLRERSRAKRDEQDQHQAAAAVVGYLDGLLRRVRTLDGL